MILFPTSVRPKPENAVVFWSILASFSHSVCCTQAITALAAASDPVTPPSQKARRMILTTGDIWIGDNGHRLSRKAASANL